MWTKIQGNLVNLDNVTEIWRDRHESKYLGVCYIGLDAETSSCFSFDTEEERDQEFDRLERLLLNERSW